MDQRPASKRRDGSTRLVGMKSGSRLERVLRGAFETVWQVHEEKKIPLRTAAYVVAATRVLEARALRGLYP